MINEKKLISQLFCLGWLNIILQMTKKDVKYFYFYIQYIIESDQQGTFVLFELCNPKSFQ